MSNLDDVKSSIYPDASSVPQPQSYQPQTQNLGHPPQNPSMNTPQPTNQYPPQNHPPQNVVYVAETLNFGPRPAQLTCPHCHQQIQTRVDYTSGLLAWLICGGCVLFGCVLGCCLIPFCMDDCKDAEHTCPACKSYLGSYKRIG
uniref:LITAF domain-containing protein n=1 Tax=Panagrolaimus davidi TaxID=227884 RepID=A0A914QYY1_9BILA